jgi:hypothetical protein
MLSLAALLLLVTILVWICAGCGSEIAPAEETPSRFTSERMTADANVRIYIVTDTETGRQYILAEMMGTSGGIGMTPLLPAEVAPHE